MEDFNFDKWISGVAHCKQCGCEWVVTVPYGQFFMVMCPKCHFPTNKIYEAYIATGILDETT